MGDVYQEYHVDQLNKLYQKTGEIVFKEYAEKWQNYLDEYRNDNSENIDNGISDTTSNEEIISVREVKEVITQTNGNPNHWSG